MEWTWREQIVLLLQCGGLGLALGVLYDWLSVYCHWHRLSRKVCFALESLFGLLAALITFFFSLATMDGRLHPLLFAGSAVGIAVQRAGISRWHRRLLYRLLSVGRFVTRCMMWPFTWCQRQILQILEKWRQKPKKIRQKAKKIHKKACNPVTKPVK